MNPILTIIIPCYNQGHYLDECIGSFKEELNALTEVIIINDGSTSAETLSHLKRYEVAGFTIIHQENKGLAEARNTGIRHSKGKYILPLDADNKIRFTVVLKAIQLMEADESISVVYGDAEYFGEKKGLWKAGPFNLQKLMISNYIDACALIRKSVFEKLGGYDAQMKYSGWEDWELWLRISFNNHVIYYLEEIFFDYRYLETSMSKSLYKNYQKPNYLENYVNTKFSGKMGHRHIHSFYVNRFRKNPVLFVIKLCLISWFPSYYNNLLLKNKIRNGI